MSDPADLDSLGFVEDEVFIEGTARSYEPVETLASISDGRWDTTPTGPTAPYKTRLLIRRPKDSARFNGMVVVEWLNVTAGYDIDSFPLMRDEVTRGGYAYVGVSNQAVGVSYLKSWETNKELPPADRGAVRAE